MNSEIQLACFKVGEERYAADIMSIKEIILCRKITRIPSAPDFIEGVINLRGQVIPVIDMRKRLGLTPAGPEGTARIIIIRVLDKDVGIIVDSVLKVLRVGKREMQPPPSIAKGVESEYLKGIVKDGDELVLLLDMEKILTTSEKVGLEDILSSDEIWEV